MAEFGVNLKKVREEKGITQQTLADQLYVTRQAVSRWEGGSRYPDLMTAKKMSQFLEISLDDLLADDDMKVYVEKNAILDDSVSKRVQIVLLSLAFMCSVVCSVIYLCNNFIQDVYVMESSETTKSILLAIVLGYAVYAALLDKINPGLVAVMSALYFGMAIITGATGFFSWQRMGMQMAYLVGATIINIVFLIICIRFFCTKKSVSPLQLYIMAGIYGLLGVVNTFWGLMVEIPIEIYRDVFIINIFAITKNMLLLVLLVYMAYMLNRKRKLAVR